MNQPKLLFASFDMHRMPTLKGQVREMQQHFAATLAHYTSFYRFHNNARLLQESQYF